MMYISRRLEFLTLIQFLSFLCRFFPATFRGPRDKETHHTGPAAERLEDCQSTGSEQSTEWRPGQGK